MSRVETLTQHVKSLDRDLFCKEENGVILVCRKARVWEEFMWDGKNVLYSRDVPQVVFALTEDFTQKTRAVDWGIEPIRHRVRGIDLHGDNSFVQHVVRDLERAADLDAAHRRSQFEDIAREIRPIFKKAFSDVNVSSLEKIDRRRMKDGSH